MTALWKGPPSSGYEVGYGKPPRGTRFRKGQSGNPGGRPLGAMTTRRAAQLILKEAYRKVRVRAGDKVIELPAIQAVVRAQLARGVNGNGPAQQSAIANVQVIERDNAMQAEVSKINQDATEMSELEAARRVAFLLTKANRKLEQDD
jgi:hypothetical protein